MKNSKEQKPLKVSLYGMNDRTQKMMLTYLELTCNGVAQVVDSNESQAEIIDLDQLGSTSLLEQRLRQTPSKPIVALSLQECSLNKVIYIKKPLEVPKVINALEKVRKNLLHRNIGKNKINDSDRVSKVQAAKLVESQNNSTVPKAKNIMPPGKTVQAEKQEDEIPGGGVPASKKPNTTANNRRKTTRYIFRAIKGNLKQRSLLRGAENLPVLLLVISSKGALIRLYKPVNLHKKVTLEIQFDLQHIFTVPAIVVRKKSSCIYGLDFIDHEYGLTHYLVNSGRQFKFG